LTTPELVDDFFRHEYGRLVATLSRRVGLEHVEAVEDAVQGALMTALESWTTAGLPKSPSAWLFRVANNRLLDELRTQNRRQGLLEAHSRERMEAAGRGFAQIQDKDAEDDLLGMLFVCCDEAIPVESQLVLALKTLCGFDVREIGTRLFISDANVYKRLTRARQRLRDGIDWGDDLAGRRSPSRLSSVHKILYLLFTEGYLSSRADTAIRRELCDEAVRLACILAADRMGASPETSALLALMHLQSARLSAREDGSGGLLLLEEQDRDLWDQTKIQTGLEWLAKSAEGDVFTRYHAEAAIAAEHCLAPSFTETRWEKVVQSYSLLEQMAPSAIHRLNRAVAVAEWKGPAAGLAILDGLEPPTWLSGSYMWSAVLADLHQRCGNADIARNYHKIACEQAPTPAVRDLMERRRKMFSADDQSAPPPSQQ
jgi:RNA polymerase sigma-70 factor (ECF subfamily)